MKKQKSFMAALAKALRFSLVTLVTMWPAGDLFSQQVVLTDKIFGVTIDNPWVPANIAAAFRAHAVKPTARIVFDEYAANVSATDYIDVMPAIRDACTVMGLILDSQFSAPYSAARYAQRMRDFIDTVGQWVDIWEIGNEVNGDWTGSPADVAAKVYAAFRICKEKNLKTAVNFYYNRACYYNKYQYEMFNWINTNVPDSMKNGLDYVFFSYYPDDCENVVPPLAEWRTVIDSLGTIFPNAKLGFGEVGTSKTALTKAAYMHRYYDTVFSGISHPRFVGGFFWWYYSTDCVPRTKALWDTLDALARKWIPATPVHEYSPPGRNPGNTAVHGTGEGRGNAPVKIYNMKGALVRTVFTGFGAQPLPDGIYFRQHGSGAPPLSRSVKTADVGRHR